MSKGGAAGGGSPEELAQINIPTPADLLKEEEEDSFAHSADLRSGRLSLSTGALLTAGTGEFPYSLPFSRSFQTGGAGPSEPAWDHNWNMPLTISGSGNELLGSSRALLASESIAMLSVIYGAYSDAGTSAHARIKQEVTGALAAAWWTDRMTHNVASAGVNGQNIQFVRKLGGQQFVPSEGGSARLTQSGTRFQGLSYSDELIPTPEKFISTLAWRTDNMSFTLTNGGGDTIQYDFRRPYYREPWEGLSGGGTLGGVNSDDKPAFWATRWDFPSGMNLTFTYDYSTRADCDGSSGNPCEKPTLFKVTNSIGRYLQFTGDMDNPASVRDDAGRTVSLADDRVTHADGRVTEYDIRVINGESGYLIEKYLDAIKEPGFANNNHVFAYDVDDRLRSYTNAHGNTWTYLVGGGRRGATRDPFGNASVEYYNDEGDTVRSITKTGDTTRSEYDGLSRLIKRTMPEGDAMRVRYDANSNVVRVEQCGKSDTACANPLVTTATYNLTFNKPLSVTDPRGNTTNITYFTSGGGKYQARYVDQPVDNNGQRPRWTYAYDANGRLTSATNPEGEVQTAAYGTKGVFTGVTVDPGGLDITTSITSHNGQGDPLTVNGPRSDVSDIFTMTYDAARRPLSATDPLGTKSETIYDAHGWPIKQCVQLGSGTAPKTCAQATQSNQSWWAVTTTIYSVTGQPLTVTDPDGKTTTTTYDALDRPLASADAAGRQSLTVYDAASRPIKVIKAWAGALNGTGATQDCVDMRAATAADPQNNLQQCYQRYFYTANGQIRTVDDANGNRTTYEYDDFDRMRRTYFPDPATGGLSNPSDYEEYTYDANGNVTAKRTRDGELITSVYDKLNRMTRRTIPSDYRGNRVHDYVYDRVGRQVSAKRHATTLNYAFDNAGRLTAKDHNGVMPVSYQYDEAGNVTRLTHPDGFPVDYQFDALGRVTAAKHGSRTLASLTYDRPRAKARKLKKDRLRDRARRKSLVYANGTRADYGYSQRGDLTSHDWSRGTTALAHYDFTYNGVGQLTRETVSNATLQWTPPGNGIDNYAVNGLNQYTSVDGVAPTYDGSGNITRDHRGQTYLYDAENRLLRVKRPDGGYLNDVYYYADGNVRVMHGTKRLYYDGDQGIADIQDPWPLGGTDVSTLRRYIRLPGSVDEVLLMIDYTRSSTCTNASYGPCEVWAHQNRLGSTVYTTSSGGWTLDTYTYSSYGESGAEGDGGFPFRFTGQRIEPQTGLYYYKARFYDPETGRFLQTDPIGYEDQMNLYAYVGNDPMNLKDPKGLARCGSGLRGSDNKAKCDKTLNEAESVRNESIQNAEELNSLADAVESGELTGNQQKLLDQITKHFGASNATASRLRTFADRFRSIADTIGAKGKGAWLQASPQYSNIRGGPAEYKRGAFGQDIIVLYRSHFSSKPRGREATILHEAAHALPTDQAKSLGEFYGWGQIGYLRNQRPSYIYGNADTFACHAYPDQCGE